MEDIEKQLLADNSDMKNFKEMLNGTDRLLRSSHKPWIAGIIVVGALMALVICIISMTHKLSIDRHMDTIDRLTSQVEELQEQINELNEV